MKRPFISIIIIFIPFILNLIMTISNVYSVPQNLWSENYEETLIMVVSRSYSLQSLGMIVIQIILGYIALKKLINYNLDYRSLYSLEDIKSIVSWAIIVILIALSFILFTIEGVFTVTLFYRGNWQYYGELWRKTILNTPLWARYMNALVVPFSAGIFEEIIWRAYGITALELITTTKKAVLIQAVAFGLWHIINPIHIIPAFIIGTIYGIIYVKRRKILTLSIAHIVTNLVGFSIWIL